MEYRYSNKYKSYIKSLAQLGLSCDADAGEVFVLPATVQNFNLTFDLSWKIMKELLTNYYGVVDFATGSPKQVLRKAFSVGLISDDVWMEMLSVRNSLAHDYDGSVAQKAFERIVDDFYKEFERLKKNIYELPSDQ